jgi:MYXO-CTERM domain-containing protein
LPDPCESTQCDKYCKDGECLDDNPCLDVTCTHGCVRGRCLQPPHARGPDEDGDGFADVADCDDDNPTAHPRHRELCGNGIDDNCDGVADEPLCVDPDADLDGGRTGSAGRGAGAGSGAAGAGRDAGAAGAGSTLDGGMVDGGSGGQDDDGCGCHVVGRSRTSSPAVWLAAFAGVWLLRRRRRN